MAFSTISAFWRFCFLSAESPALSDTSLVCAGLALFRHQSSDRFNRILPLQIWPGYGSAWLASLRWGAPSSRRRGCEYQRQLAHGFGLAALAALALATVFFIGCKSGHDPLWGFATATMVLAGMLALAALAVRSGRPALVLGVIVLDLLPSVQATTADR